MPTKEELEQANGKWEIQMLEGKKQLLDTAIKFTNWDVDEFNKVVLSVVETLNTMVKENPSFLKGDASQINMDDLVKELRKQKNTDITGGDIFTDFFGGIGELINALNSIAEKEKTFFLDIIKLLFCGCK